MYQSVDAFEATADPAPSQAERALIAACRAGRFCRVADGTLPPEGTPEGDRTVRASLLRLLVDGGTPACGIHASGVCLEGARITGRLDLRFVVGRGQMVLDNADLTQNQS